MEPNEILAANINDLQNGEMKEITSGDTKIILAKVDDQFYAVGGICPHVKAPLAKGALCGHRLYCPWHHSSFNITSGQLLDPPALDGLPRYAVRVAGEDVYIQLSPLQQEEDPTKQPIFADKTFVIIGGGAAGMMAAQTLRNNSFGGKLLMITKEATPPYDRTMLSKKFLSGKMEAEKLPLRNEDFFQQHRIELEKEKEVKSVDPLEKKILFTDGNALSYDSLLIATGGEPNNLQLQGADLPNVYTLRSKQDAETILEKAKASKKACIIGSSFIGLETAASLTALGLEVTVIAKEGVPFEKNFGKEIGNWFLKLHAEKGVFIKNNAEVESINGMDQAEAVLLKSGERIDTDFVIVGIGVHPKTDFLPEQCVAEKDKSVKVDYQLKVTDNLFAAGDIARFPDAKTGELIRVEHWRLAQQQGELAALNMLGQGKSISDIVPFFWTNQFDQRLSYVGHAKEWDEIVFDGNVDDKKFLAFYVKGGKVQAVASMGRDVESDKIEDTMRKSKTLFTVAELKSYLVD
jgi:NADPH-dependent 2,4-dienoyl-CoA reductase/sulfur reductase-like enzyme/nitrite reductase/ring-hydroxylating ferredoxin subunit